MVAAESISSLIFCLGTDPPEADIRKSANTTASRFEKESFFMSKNEGNKNAKLSHPLIIRLILFVFFHGDTTDDCLPFCCFA